MFVIKDIHNACHKLVEKYIVIYKKKQTKTEHGYVIA